MTVADVASVSGLVAVCATLCAVVLTAVSTPALALGAVGGCLLVAGVARRSVLVDAGGAGLVAALVVAALQGVAPWATLGAAIATTLAVDAARHARSLAGPVAASLHLGATGAVLSVSAGVAYWLFERSVAVDPLGLAVLVLGVVGAVLALGRQTSTARDG